jgi:hypothetical protein
MTVPNANRAIIAADKLTAYLLNMSHKRGAAKARLLLSLGYRSDAAHVLESDLRSAPVARSHTHAQFCSVWQVDTGTDVPRFITMYPR